MMKFIKIYKDCILNKKGEVHQPNPQKNGVKFFSSKSFNQGISKVNV